MREKEEEEVVVVERTAPEKESSDSGIKPEQEEEEEATTLTCSSSYTSLSPENPPSLGVVFSAAAGTSLLHSRTSSSSTATSATDSINNNVDLPLPKQPEPQQRQLQTQKNLEPSTSNGDLPKQPQEPQQQQLLTQKKNPEPSTTSMFLPSSNDALSSHHHHHHPSSSPEEDDEHHSPLMLEDDDDEQPTSSQERQPLLLPPQAPPPPPMSSTAQSATFLYQHRRLPSTIYEDKEKPGPSSSFNEHSGGEGGEEDSQGWTTEHDDDDDDDADDDDQPQPLPSPLTLQRKAHSLDNLQDYSTLSSNSNSSLAAMARASTTTTRSSSYQSLSTMATAATTCSNSSSSSPSLLSRQFQQQQKFVPLFTTTRLYGRLSQKLLLRRQYSPTAAATWIGFWALLHVTCANYVLTPVRDAIALQIGVKHMPVLTLMSTVLAFLSSVPIGWLFEAPDPQRRKVWKRMGLTRGETQGTSLALFYRCFAAVLISYAVGFQLLRWLVVQEEEQPNDNTTVQDNNSETCSWWSDWDQIWSVVGKGLYVAFFLVVHLMKLHSLSLVWGVTTEAMEYEEVALRKKNFGLDKTRTRYQRLALVGFGGTVGGVLGSGLASSMAQVLRLPGLLVLAAVLLEVSAELSIELGRVMRKHWEEQQLFQSSNDLASLDTSMKRSVSLGSMKRVASGNSLNRVNSASELAKSASCARSSSTSSSSSVEDANDNTFMQRLMRGVKTILRSRLLMAIFTYNALYASTTVLLSFQRAALVANRKGSTTAEADTAFLANVNMASSVAIFALQASGLGAYVAHACGSRGTLALMPLIRLLGVLALAWWHQTSNGQPPNLLVFLVVDECCKIMNLAVAKPVRESLWRGLSNEARYEAKPIVDTLANRWGGGSAAFMVSFINRTLDLFGFEPGPDGARSVFGFPPILFLCMVIAAWWAVVSADLGHIRRRIDLELKKVQ